MYDNKIVLAIFSLQGGGAERFVLTVAEGFRQLGYEPHIVCFKSKLIMKMCHFPYIF